MNAGEMQRRFAEVCGEELPLPGAGETAARHRRLVDVAREDVSLAKLAEAHWDAGAILREAGREPVAGALYAVWASEIPGQAMVWESGRLCGTKMFCSGAGLVDRALITAGELMVEVDLRGSEALIDVDGSAWKTEAFRMTQTSALTFRDVPAEVVGEANWYVERAGFWNGACGPAACWAGGVAGLLDFAMRSKRDDAHTLAHLAAMDANVWSMQACLDAAGREIDAAPGDRKAAMVRALRVRHVVEQMCTDTLRRFARAYGPHPLAMDGEMSRRYQECDLYLRQSHGERDLEGLGRALRVPSAAEAAAS